MTVNMEVPIQPIKGILNKSDYLKRYVLVDMQ